MIKCLVFITWRSLEGNQNLLHNSNVLTSQYKLYHLLSFSETRKRVVEEMCKEKASKAYYFIGKSRSVDY